MKVHDHLNMTGMKNTQRTWDDCLQETEKSMKKKGQKLRENGKLYQINTKIYFVQILNIFGVKNIAVNLCNLNRTVFPQTPCTDLSIRGFTP